MNLILTPLRIEAGIVLAHLRGVRPVSIDGAARCWTGRAPCSGRLAVGCTGWGVRQARTRTGTLLDRLDPELVVGWGTAGALAQGVNAGDLAVCCRVVAGMTGNVLDMRGTADGIEPAFAGPARCRMLPVSGLTWPHPVLRRSTRRSLARRFDCQVVEMENAALARLARGSGAGFLPMRTILDDFSFPPPVSLRYMRFLRDSLHAGARAAVGAAAG